MYYKDKGAFTSTCKWSLMQNKKKKKKKESYHEIFSEPPPPSDLQTLLEYVFANGFPKIN